jgi:hypothetical protein
VLAQLRHQLGVATGEDVDLVVAALLVEGDHLGAVVAEGHLERTERGGEECGRVR